ncbi:MAG: helix-turn-helix domain-containing protein [Balneolales bacterium]|nr:helix-turn-helix domain-containing protein [Balneolales bacterium]
MQLGLNDSIKEPRLEEGKTLLEEKGFSVKEAAAAVGFPGVNYFSTLFKKRFGTSPSKAGKGESGYT